MLLAGSLALPVMAAVSGGASTVPAVAGGARLVRSMFFDDSAMFSQLVSAFFAIAPVPTTSAPPSPVPTLDLRSAGGAGAPSFTGAAKPAGVTAPAPMASGLPVLRGMERRQALLRCRDLRTQLGARPDASRIASVVR